MTQFKKALQEKQVATIFIKSMMNELGDLSVHFEDVLELDEFVALYAKDFSYEEVVTPWCYAFTYLKYEPENQFFYFARNRDDSYVCTLGETEETTCYVKTKETTCYGKTFKFTYMLDNNELFATIAAYTLAFAEKLFQDNYGNVEIIVVEAL